MNFLLVVLFHISAIIQKLCTPIVMVVKLPLICLSDSFVDLEYL